MKNTMNAWVFLICLQTLSLLGAATKTPSPDFSGANWIWDSGAGDQKGSWYFCKGFTFAAGQEAHKATLIITCDNDWTLSVNGREVGQSDGEPNAWRRPQVLDVTSHLLVEQNALAVKGINTIPGPAGLLLKLVVEFEDGTQFQQVSDRSWMSTGIPEEAWSQVGFTPGAGWKPVRHVSVHGDAPWGKVTVGGNAPPPQKKVVASKDRDYPQETVFTDAIFQEGIVFVAENLNLHSGGQPTFTQFVRGTRAYFEMDPMTPAALGGQLWSLIPFRPDGKRTLLVNGNGGKIGSPSVSYDGASIFFSMAKKDDVFFHIYSIAPDGTQFRQITTGPFHDYDPVELPDGRLVFSSTRLGCREEYHAKYASSLFTCKPDGSTIRPLTYHISADREPRVLADGSLAFLRMDTFMERAKVEVHVHQTRMDGTGGQVIIGPGRGGARLDRDVAAEHNMAWLRHYGAGSPAPLPDGRVAALNQAGLVTSAIATGKPLGSGFLPYDLSTFPDGRLLCTSLQKTKVLVFNPADNSVKQVVTAQDLHVPNLHSVVPLGKRKKPRVMPSTVDPVLDRRLDKTGFLYCQNVLNTQHTDADLKRVTAVRIYEGRPFTLEPTKSIYEHIGTVGVELGTVPLAEDGSFYVEVPADRPLAMQAVDGEGRAVINELSWIYTRPGEQRSCVGCHAAPESAPGRSPSHALRSKPLQLLGKGRPHRFRANNGANGGLLNLQLDRFREAAAINLYEPGEPGTLSTLQQSGILRDRSAVPDLVNALKSPLTEVRCAAALSLSACGNREAVPALMAALSDSSPTVTLAAANALEHLTGDRDGGTNWPAIENRLIERLSGKEAQDVHLAVEALGHVGSDFGQQALLHYLETHPDGELRILMATIRSLGYLQARSAVSHLTSVMNDHLTKKGKGGFHELGFGQKPIYLTATAAEALGRIGGDAAEQAILTAFGGLNPFNDYVFRTAEHGWLQGVHASVPHYRMLEALDRMESTRAAALVPRILESLPADKDRGLLYQRDSYEHLSARVIARSGRSDEVIEACLAILGQSEAPPMSPILRRAVTVSPHAERHIRKHSEQARAAQVLSIVCDHPKYIEAIEQLLSDYRNAEASETRSWVCFMLIRTLGRIGDSSSVPLLIDILKNDPTETALGQNLPPQHLIYKGWRPFHRPAAAWALGQLGDSRACVALLDSVENLDNASSTREQAARALGHIGNTEYLTPLKQLSLEYPEVTTRRAILTSIEQLSSL